MAGHYKAKHPEVSEHCPICSELGPNGGALGTLNTHLLNYHRSELAPEVQAALTAVEGSGTNNPTPYSSAGLFRCTHCSQSFNSGTDIKVHLTQSHDIAKDFALHYRSVQIVNQDQSSIFTNLVLGWGTVDHA